MMMTIIEINLFINSLKTLLGNIVSNLITMAALVNALDNSTFTQIGENGHNEYGWSANLYEKIVQFSFQITRTELDTVDKIGLKLEELLTSIQFNYTNAKISKEEYIDMLSILYKMIGQTRDIIDGKGEYTLAYMMIYQWYNFFPELAKFALKLFVLSEDSKVHPYGSWKDMKYFCYYCKLRGPASKNAIIHPLVSYVISLMNEQLRHDTVASTPSLLAKWIPREKSKKFGWLFKELAVNYYYHYIQSVKEESKINAAILKCFTEYRKLCSTLNTKLDTVQIKQCSGNWSQIDPDNQTSITMHKQKKAFLNKNKKGGQRSELSDRIECAGHFKEYIEKAVKGEVKVKGKRIGLNDFTKDALALIGSSDTDSIDLLNAQWNDNGTQTGALNNMIAMVDVSGSMTGEPLHAAIALGIRVAEKSALGKRVLTFSATPTWVNLDGYDTFDKMVNVLQHAEWGMNTNIHAALKQILNAIKTSKMNCETVSSMTLVIFSDMQIDEADSTSLSLYDDIENLYSTLGIEMYGKPFKPPHILFWNLRSTNGFPTLSTQSNVSCMSGFSPSLLNLFCEQGIAGLQTCTPWKSLLKSLENPRYEVLECELKSHFDNLS